MMTPPTSRPATTHKVSLAATLFVVVLAGWAIYTLHDNLSMDERIAAGTDRIAELAPWSAAGVWLAEATKAWEPGLNSQYEQLFPLELDREGLYLTLAGLAHDCGIEPISLRRCVAPNHMPGGDDGADPLGSESDIDAMIADFAPPAGSLPVSDLDVHRIEVEFRSGYGAMTRFLESLASISRAVTLCDLRTLPAKRGLVVTMELEFYVRQPN